MEFIAKRVFIDMKVEGGWKKVPVVHKSVILDSGITVRWNKKGECWTLTHPARWDSAVATSLTTRAMVVAQECGRLRSEKESYHAFQNFQTRMATLVTATEFIQIVQWFGR